MGPLALGGRPQKVSLLFRENVCDKIFKIDGTTLFSKYAVFIKKTLATGTPWLLDSHIFGAVPSGRYQ